MTRKKELLPRHHWIIYSRGQIKLDPARNQSLCQQCQAWVKLQLALCLLLLMILQLYHLPPPLPSPLINSSFLFTRYQSLYASCCTVLFRVLHCEVTDVVFIFCICIFMYCLCEKYHKPITVQYYIANCDSWVPRLTMLELWTNLTYKHALEMKLVHM